MRYNDLRESFVCFLFPKFLQKRCNISRGLLYICDVGDNRELFGGTDGLSLLYMWLISSFECQKLVLTLFFLLSCSDDLIPLKQMENFVRLSMEYINIWKWTFFSSKFIYCFIFFNGTSIESLLFFTWVLLVCKKWSSNAEELRLR